MGGRPELLLALGGQGALHLPPLRSHRPQPLPLHLGHPLLQTLQRAEEAGEEKRLLQCLIVRKLVCHECHDCMRPKISH